MIDMDMLIAEINGTDQQQYGEDEVKDWDKIYAEQALAEDRLMEAEFRADHPYVVIVGTK